MIRKNKKPEEHENWLETYGNIVTSLLCFFVLLFSISSVDQRKWDMLIQKNDSRVEVNSEQADSDGSTGMEEATDGLAGDNGEIADFNELYLLLKSAVEKRNLQESIEVTRENGFTFMSIHESVLFDNNGSVLLQGGKEMLDEIAAVMSRSKETIKEVYVLSHTSPNNPEMINNVRNDRMLSSMRSSEVVIYLQSKDAVSPEILTGVSFGQYRPIASNETEEGRIKNRRVDIIITQAGITEKSLEEYYNQIYYSNQAEEDN